MIDDVFAVYEIQLIGREMLDGRPTIVASLTPRKKVKTRSDAGSYLKKMRGKAWVNESDRQVVRIEMEGKTKGLVPEFTIKGPMQEQIEQMADALRRRIERA